MTETSGPELDLPGKQGSRLRGVLGALLGAFFAALLCHLLLFFLPDEAGKLALFGSMLLTGLCACWGYRLLRGYRSMKFAMWTVRLSIAVTQPLAFAMALTLLALWQGPGAQVPAGLFANLFVRSLRYMLTRDLLPYLGMLILGCLLFCRLSWGFLLKYADPAWYGDPRRLAQIGGGGATFNYPPVWPLPAAEHIPSRFTVDKGKLTVEGTTITFKAWGKPPRTFSVSDVAGVVLGVSTGYNILYDRENRMLARFAWSRKNAILFGQYLMGRDVPFVDTNGSAVHTTPETARRQAVSRQFTVREGKFCLILGWIGEILFGGGLAAAILFMEGIERLVCGVGLLFLVGLFTWILLCYYRRRLEVDGEDLTYTTSLGRTTRFRASQVGDILWSVNGCKLKDREGKTLARLENNMKNAALFAAYWNEYKQERTE